MGVKTCSTGCAKNNQMDLNESTASAKRRKSKKTLRPTIEATASMALKKEDELSINKIDPNALPPESAVATQPAEEQLVFPAQGQDQRESVTSFNSMQKKGKGKTEQDLSDDDKVMVNHPDQEDYTQRMKEGMKPRTLIICLGRREAGLDLHVPIIANSQDLDIVASRDIIQRAMSALSDGPSLETREKIKASIAKGELIDDQIMIQLFKELEESSHPKPKPSMVSQASEDQNERVRGFVFTGFPRTRQQARMLNNIIEDQNKFNYNLIVLYFKMNDDHKILKRAPKYRSMPSQVNTKDDLFTSRKNPLTADQLVDYRKEIESVVNFYQAEEYQQEQILYEINADKKAHDIYEQVSKALAAKGLILDAIDVEKMNLWDLNNNQKYTEIKGTETSQTIQQQEVAANPYPQVIENKQESQPNQPSVSQNEVVQQANPVQVEAQPPIDQFEEQNTIIAEQTDTKIVKEVPDMMIKDQQEDGSTLLPASNREDDVFESFRPDDQNNMMISKMKPQALDVEELDGEEINQDGLSFSQAQSEKPHEDVILQQVKEVKKDVDNLLDESQEDKQMENGMQKVMIDDESAMDFANDEFEEATEVNKDLQQSERVTQRRSTMTGGSKQLEQDQSINRSEKSKRLRKQTIQDQALKQFQEAEQEEDDAGTEIGFDNGNTLLDDNQVRNSTTQLIQNSSQLNQTQESEMVRAGPNQTFDDQSEGSYMVRGDSKLPPGFDDQSSQGFVRKVQIDDMSSQGSYLKKVRGFDDVESEGSFMMKGNNAPGNGAQIFDGDDDGSEAEMRRGSIHSSMIHGGKDERMSSQIEKIDEEDEDENTATKESLKIKKAQSEIV